MNMVLLNPNGYSQTLRYPRLGKFPHFLCKCFYFFIFSNKIALFKTLTVWQLRVDLESLQKLELSLGASDPESIRYYLFSAICFPLGKGLYGRTEHAPEVSVTKKHFNIFNSLAANAAEHMILIEASAWYFFNKRYKKIKLRKKY